jgi:arabinogalactan oligomer/maltooligosaccharide transport system permease protein
MKKWTMSAIVPHLILIPATIATLYPVLWVVKMALTPSQAFDASLNPIPSDVTLDNFTHLLSATNRHGDLLFARQALNSFIIAGATTVVGIFLSCTAAFAFSRFRFPGRQAALTGFLLTQIFPGVVMTVPLYILLNRLGLLNSLLGLTLVYSTTAIPFCTYMLKGYFDTLPKELEEAALIDGASHFTIFWRIMLPLARPAIAVALRRRIPDPVGLLRRRFDPGQLGGDGRVLRPAETPGGRAHRRLGQRLASTVRSRRPHR